MRALRTLLLVASLLPLAGCFGALANLDAYTIRNAGAFCWNLSGYSPHAVSAMAMPQAVGMRVIDQTNTVQAMVIYDPLPTPNVMGTLAGPLVPGDTYHVQIFADRNMNRMIDPYPTDHTWDLDYAMFQTMGCFTFPHGNPFNMTDTVASRPDDPMSGNATVMIGGRVLADTRVLVMILHDVDGMADVGYYRYVVRPTVDPLAFQDLIAGDSTYKLDAFFDMNDSGARDPGEPQFSDTQISGTAGTDIQFTIDLARPLPPP